MKNIKSDYKNYDDIIEAIGEDRIKERLTAIKKIYIEFLENIKKNNTEILLNERILMHVILDYFTDITRFKQFHNIERVNKDKIISYEISWFLRRKPIQVLVDDKEELVYINEKFALGLLVNHLTEGRIDDFSKSKLLKNYCNVLLYYLKYRNCDPKVLEMLIMSFKVGNSLDEIKYKN